MSAKVSEPFDCTTPFINTIRRGKAEVEIYLSSGARLQGFVRNFDDHSILFCGGPKNEKEREQLIMRSAIVSIIPLQE